MGHKNDNIKLLNLDWLQFSVMNSKKYLANKNWIKQDFQTRLFSNIYYYIEEGIKYFELVCTPKSSILNENLCIIKVDNELLYKSYCFNIISDILIDEAFVYNNLTRVDICLDFERFDNEMFAVELIHGFFIDKYLKNNQAAYKIIGTQKYMNMPEYLRFGSGNSSVSAYIYNKSKEFRDVKHKTYISEMWQKNGLQSFMDIWRLEFSIKEFNKVLTDKETGNQLVIDLLYLSNKENLKTLFAALYDKYFDFRINQNGTNKSRMKRMQLFELEQFKTCWYSEQENLSSDRSDKIMIKKLNSMQDEIRAYNCDYADDIELMKCYLIKKKRLENWAADRKLYDSENENKHTKYYLENEQITINSLYNL